MHSTCKTEINKIRFSGTTGHSTCKTEIRIMCTLVYDLLHIIFPNLEPNVSDYALVIDQVTFTLLKFTA